MLGETKKYYQPKIFNLDYHLENVPDTHGSKALELAQELKKMILHY